MAAGAPASPHKFRGVEGPCATCGTIADSGAQIADIETTTTSGHADLFRYGTQHVCPACAWLFSAGKGKPGNYIAAGDRFEYAVISLESVVEDKRPWIDVLRDLSALPADTPVAGVMTTDVKPRLWPRVRPATIGRFGLYVHCPDYDVSEWRAFDLRACVDLIELMIAPLTAGFAKASSYHGLLRDFARAGKDMAQAMAWESALSAHRQQPHFLPAVIAAGVTKEQKRDVKPTARPAANPESAPAGGHQPDQAQLGLF
jgi:hypothetical protein